MKLVLKSNKVVAIHDDTQVITPIMYPGCNIKIAPKGTTVNIIDGTYVLPEGGSLTDAKFYVSKLNIVERLETIGKRNIVKAALAQDAYQQDRWDAAIEIASDDTGVIALLQACGLTSEQIAVVLAI